MYVYLEPQGGFNDIMVTIHYAINYCIKYNRILLINGLRTTYKINFSDYFDFKRHNVICDINKITEICNNNNSVYPACLNNKMLDILNDKCTFIFASGKPGFTYNGVVLDLPSMKREETIIIFAKCGGGDGYTLFKQLNFHPNLLNTCKERYNLLKKPYLCIQIRNTDYKCNYQELYNAHKTQIHDFNDRLYIATDDKNALDFFKTRKLDFKNFTTFPSTSSYYSLHTSDINPRDKFIDMLCEIYIIAMSSQLLSNSNGGFIQLVRSCFNNKNNIFQQFQ
jgi:hypothetical protein